MGLSMFGETVKSCYKVIFVQDMYVVYNEIEVGGNVNTITKLGRRYSNR